MARLKFYHIFYYFLIIVGSVQSVQLRREVGLRHGTAEGLRRTSNQVPCFVTWLETIKHTVAEKRIDKHIRMVMYCTYLILNFRFHLHYTACQLRRIKWACRPVAPEQFVGGGLGEGTRSVI